MARNLRVRQRGRCYHTILRLWQQYHRADHIFTELFGLNKSQFEILFKLLKPEITTKPVRYVNRLIRSRDELALFLRFLVSGKCFSYHAKYYNIAIVSVTKVVNKVNALILRKLKPIAMPPVSRALWQRNSNDFMRIHKIPHCLGSAYGRFLNIVDHETHVLLMIINAEQKFVIVDVGNYDTIPERIWRNSTLGKQFEKNKFKLPTNLEVDNYDKPLPYVLVGGNSFPQRPYLLTKFRDQFDEAKIVFDTRIDVVKADAEAAVTRFRRRWQFVQCPIAVPKVRVERLIIAATCLENYFTSPPRRFRRCSDRMISAARVARLRASISSDESDVRDQFLDYFLSPAGQVPWQYDNLPMEDD